MPSLFLAILPLGFLFLPVRHLKIIFVLSLIYLRATTFFNLGLLFLGLILMVFFERWFLLNFFHRSAWQTLVLSGLGLALFYLVVFSLNWFLGLTQSSIALGQIVNIFVLTAVSALASFLFSKTLFKDLA